jgi:DNA-binding PadR family transcriptional regulator
MDTPTENHTAPTAAVLHILLALADGERHGYGIMQEIAQFTGGTFTLGPGTLYRSIKQMLEQGLIAETETRADPALDDERRRYYKLTGKGERALHAELARLDALVQVGWIRTLKGGASL